MWPSPFKFDHNNRADDVNIILMTFNVGGVPLLLVNAMGLLYCQAMVKLTTNGVNVGKVSCAVI